MRQSSASVRRKGKKAAQVQRIEEPPRRLYVTLLELSARLFRIGFGSLVRIDSRRRQLRAERCWTLRSVEPNVDECVFCDLCIHAAPASVRAMKLYG